MNSAEIYISCVYNDMLELSSFKSSVEILLGFIQSALLNIWLYITSISLLVLQGR